MSVDQQFNSVLQKIKEIYQFLTAGNPSPDDEIEAREQLLTSFNSLKSINPSSTLIGKIDKILEDLRNWDSLELWFSETTLPVDIKDILRLPGEIKSETSEHLSSKAESVEKNKISEPEIDLTDIFNKVSDQFKGEIDNLKGKIEDLKKELEKKDATLKTVREPKQVKKITPKRDSKLPPPKIRIPVIKKPASLPPKKPVMKESKAEPDPKTLKEIKLEPINPNTEPQKQELTPIPPKSVLDPTEPKVPKLIPIPTDKGGLKPRSVKIPEQKPIKPERRRIVPIVTEVNNSKAELSKQTEEANMTPKIETPIISSVEIEEIESEEMKSSGTDLFNVFSSVGEKDESKKVDPKKKSATNLSNPPPKMKETQKSENDTEESKTTSFVNFGNLSPEKEPTPQHPAGDELSDNKDTLYQELIALEGRRYSLEKNFKELDSRYNKGSLGDAQYKSESDNLKTKLGEITSRIYKIRRIISSL